MLIVMSYRARWSTILAIHVQSAACADVSTISRDAPSVDDLSVRTNGLVLGPRGCDLRGFVLQKLLAVITDSL